jgi:predicted ester cyclase
LRDAPQCIQSAMSTIEETAELFFEACETGKGWAGCQQYCHPDATFAAQADALADVTTLEAYTEWMLGLMKILPDGKAEVRSFAVDVTRNNVAVFGVFHGTHTGDGGPMPPTGKSAEADYVYVMDFDGDKIRHMTKIWNDGMTMRQLGWA